MDSGSKVLPVTSNLGVVVALLITGNEISRDSLPHESSIVVPLPKKHSGLKSLALLRTPPSKLFILCVGEWGCWVWRSVQEHFRNAFAFSQWQIRRQREGVVRDRGERVG
jgi:hypothetical protein